MLHLLKEPRTCRNKDHIICLSCISQYFKVNAQTYPECNEHLSVDALRRPRVVNNILSKLQINCDYASRGCPEFICLEDLETHVANCGYSSLMRSNAECGMEINKREPRQDILVVGGEGERNEGGSTEIYSCEKNGWFEVSPMNEEHSVASLFIDKNQVFVVGGRFSKTIESLDIDKFPLTWKKIPGELTYACGSHQTVVCQQSVINIGRYNYDEHKQSNLISELQLTSPCAMKELCQMPESRDSHGVEVVEDKLLILGGFNSDVVAMDSVFEFDPTTNECKEIPRLPFVLSEMATVQCKDDIVMLGGVDKDAQVRNDVFMYSSKTGKITALPSMLEERYGCCAVIIGDTIVVMGGEDDFGALNSVECFTMGSSTWEYLPAMNYARYAAVAEVLLSGKKYV